MIGLDKKYEIIDRFVIDLDQLPVK